MATSKKKLSKWAENIKNCRLKHNVALATVARVAKVGEETMRRMEAGKACNLKKIEAVAKALGLTLADVFEGC